MTTLKHTRRTSPIMLAVFSCLFGCGGLFLLSFVQTKLEQSELVTMMTPILNLIPYLRWGFIGFMLLSLGVAFFKWRQQKVWFESHLGLQDLRRMSWDEFERFSSEGYRRQGWQVFENQGKGPQADGGIDLILKKPGQKVIVQCKCWRGKVGVKVVREMYGLMHHHKANGVKIIATGGYTKSAHLFAKNKPIELVSPQTLLALKK